VRRVTSSRRNRESHVRGLSTSSNPHHRQLALSRRRSVPRRDRASAREPSSCRSGRLAVPRAHEPPPPGVTRRGFGKQPSSMGFVGPSTLAEAGSDSRRGCLPRLRGVLGFSQPLDALLRPSPLRPCFMPVTPLGFSLSEVCPSPVASRASRRRLPLMPFHIDSAPSSARTTVSSESRLQGFEHPQSPFPTGRCYPIVRQADPLLALTSPRSSPRGLGLVLPRSLLSWAWVTTSRSGVPKDTVLRHRARSSESQRTAGWRVSREIHRPP
jgi:hypothetical protein